MKTMNIILFATLLSWSSQADQEKIQHSCIKRPDQSASTLIERILQAKEGTNAAACCSWSTDPLKPIPGCMSGC